MVRMESVARKTISNELASSFSGAFCCPPGRKHASEHTKTQGLSVSNRNTVCDKKITYFFCFDLISTIHNIIVALYFLIFFIS